MLIDLNSLSIRKKVIITIKKSEIGSDIHIPESPIKIGSTRTTGAKIITCLAIRRRLAIPPLPKAWKKVVDKRIKPCNKNQC